MRRALWEPRGEEQAAWTGDGGDLISGVRQIWPQLHPFLTSAKMFSFPEPRFSHDGDGDDEENSGENYEHLLQFFTLLAFFLFHSQNKPYLEIIIPVSVSEVNKARLREIQKTCPRSCS